MTHRKVSFNSYITCLTYISNIPCHLHHISLVSQFTCHISDQTDLHHMVLTFAIICHTHHLYHKSFTSHITCITQHLHHTSLTIHQTSLNSHITYITSDSFWCASCVKCAQILLWTHYFINYAS